MAAPQKGRPGRPVDIDEPSGVDPVPVPKISLLAKLAAARVNAVSHEEAGALLAIEGALVDCKLRASSVSATLGDNHADLLAQIAAL